MKMLQIKPSVFMFKTCQEFVDAYDIKDTDLVITNKYIYDPFFGKMALKCHVLYQEEYGLGEPSDEMAEAIYAAMPKNVKRIIAIGGGTIIDISKLYALKNVSPILDLYDRKMDIIKDKELVLVPTTCGTGSEVTNISILELKSRHTKLGLAVDELYADSAVMIPELLTGLPFKFFATSSVDALIHAFESSLSPKATPYTKLFGYKAIELILKGYLEIAKKGEDARIPLLGDFLIASNYAGIAFGNAGCAAVHAMSYPLGGTYHVPHGEANYAIFTEVFKTYQKMNPNGAIKDFDAFIAGILGCKADNVYDELEKLLNKVIQRKPLHEYGVTKEDIDTFTDNVMTKQGRLMANNYVELDAAKVKEIYNALY